MTAGHELSSVPFLAVKSCKSLISTMCYMISLFRLRMLFSAISSMRLLDVAAASAPSKTI